jgi:hypothetical protein
MTELTDNWTTARSSFGQARPRSRDGELPGEFNSLLSVAGSGRTVVRTVEAEIIPRLVLAHGRVAQVAHAASDQGRDDRIASFADHILGAQHASAVDTVLRLREHGVDLETIYLDLLAPTAGHMRHLWKTDLWDFADVTLGLWRLQQMLRDLSPAFCKDASHRASGLRALLAPGPGDRNDLGYMMFGLVLAGEFFRRDGWETWIEPDTKAREFGEAVRSQWFDVVEFFANSDKKLDDLASSIRMVRRESPNPGVGVMVCGQAFIDRPELVLLVGGDAIVSDLSVEASQARNVVNLLSDRR